MASTRRERRELERLQEKVAKRALPIAPDTPIRQSIRLKYATDLAAGMRRAELLATAHGEADWMASKAFEKTGAPACRAGCTYCCNVHVAVFADEAREVASKVRQLPADVAADVRRRADENAERAKGHTSGKYPMMPCALLDGEGKCCVYDSRPFACRSHHSFEVAMCRRAYEGETVGAPCNAVARMVHAEFSTAFAEAIASTGEKPDSYELHQALSILLRGERDLSAARTLIDVEEMARDFAAVNPAMAIDGKSRRGS